MYDAFEIVGEITEVETIAVGPGVRALPYLGDTHGRGRWRKLKGIALVRVPSGRVRTVELPWYEAHGIGKREMKIKRYMDEP